MTCARAVATLLRVGVGATGAILLAGCSDAGTSRADTAAQTAHAFTDAVTTSPAVACALLAPDTRQELEDTSGPCPRSLPNTYLPAGGRVLKADVYGLDARVQLEHDTVFLALFDTGWRVTAAGCTPTEQDRPYSCEIKKG